MREGGGEQTAQKTTGQRTVTFKISMQQMILILSLIKSDLTEVMRFNSNMSSSQISQIIVCKSESVSFCLCMAHISVLQGRPLGKVELKVLLRNRMHIQLVSHFSQCKLNAQHKYNDVTLKIQPNKLYSFRQCHSQIVPESLILSPS